jgi:AraC family transcriptional regulator
VSEPSYKHLSSWLRPDGAQSLTVHTLQKSTLAMMVIQYGGPALEETGDVIVPEDAQTVGWNLRGAKSVECVMRNPKTKAPVFEGQTMFCSLQDLDFLRLTEPCVAQHFLMPRMFLDELAEDLEARPIHHVGRPEMPVDDPILAALGTRVLAYMRAPEELDVLLADHIMTSLAVYVCGRYGDLVMHRPFKGGLTRWQVRLAQAMIDANLAEGVSVKTLAEACGLRASHFAHAFKRSVGVAPHQWLIGRRLDRARALLLDQKLHLADVGTLCGFADQSHLTRTFQRHFGLTPSAWRRAA